MKKKRGVLFSTDALLALVIILLSLLIIYPTIKYASHPSDVQGDLVVVLSSLKIGEIDSAYVQSLISSGEIEDLNKSVLEQIGEFYAIGSPYAEGLAQDVLSGLDVRENLGIWYGPDLLASVGTMPFEDAKNVEVARQGISGIQKGSSTKGYSTRVFLSKAFANEYFYFGGYVGDGNISARLDFEGDIEGLVLEIAVSDEFDIYINGIFSGHYQESESQFIPAKYDLSSYLPNFHSGSNIVELIGSVGNLNIGGGYIRVSYEGSSIYEPQTRKYFPGIEGIINLYDGFYVPGELDNLRASLHLDTEYVAFLSIGNVTVFNGSTVGEQTITLSNSELSSMLDYGALSMKTIPIRLGVENVSYIRNITKNADVFSVIELSGSINQNVPSVGKKVLELIKEGNEAFIVSLLEDLNNRIGLVGYGMDAEDTTLQHNLSNDIISLNNTLYSFAGGEPTCICCGINKAVEKFLVESDSSKAQSIVVMSDGKANVGCGGDAKQDAIDAACNAYNNFGIIVHVVGFGPTTTIDETTLRAIASCGNGTYYYSDATQLAEIYKQVAQEIIEASYSEQTIEISGNLSTTLYSDSYLEFNYTKPNVSYGLVLTAESDNFNDVSEGILTIESDVEVLEASAISYSGPRWTYRVEVNGSEVYDLSDYGSNFIELGDPYAISIPPSFISVGDNLVRETTAISPDEILGGSSSNKVIYTVSKPFASYSEILSTAEGCEWTVAFEDNSTKVLKVPMNYSGPNVCSYQPESCDAYHENDAIDVAVYNLLKDLDFDDDCKIDINFMPQDLYIDSNEITGIPFTWETEVQVRVWY